MKCFRGQRNLWWGVAVGILLWAVWDVPVAAKVIITPSVSLTEMYYDNVLYSPNGFPKEEDFGTSVFPSVGFDQLNFGDLGVSGSVGVGGTAFKNNPDLSFFSGFSGVTVDADNLAGNLVRGLKLKVTEDLYFSNDPFGGTGGAAGGIGGVLATNTAGDLAGISSRFDQTRRKGYLGFLTVRDAFLLNDLFVLTSYPFSDDTTLALSYTNSQAVFDPEQLVDEQVNAGYANVDTRIASGTRLNVTYGISNYSFSLPDGGTQSQTTHDGGLTLTQVIAEGLLISAELGMVYLPSEKDVETFYSGTVILGEDLSPTRLTSVGLSYVRDVESAQGLTPELLVSDVAGLNVTHQVSRETTLSAFVQYFKYSSIGTDTVNLSGIMAGPSLNYTLTPTTYLSLSYMFFSQKGVGEASTVELNQVTAGITMSFP